MNNLPGQTGGTQFKVPFVGDSSVGKTSIVSRYNEKKFTGNMPSTVGVSNVQLQIKVKNQKVDMTVWDTAGQEKFLSLVPLYTRHSDLLIIVFDMSNQKTFDGVEQWFQRAREDLDLKCPIIICGNKIDLPSAIEKQAVEDWAKSHECIACFTSAKDGDGVDNLFQTAAEKLISSRPATSSSFGSCPNLEAAQQKKGCC
ncbi:Ras-related protein Rab-21 [Tritrichomonas foetus]|uniref:Ras-related protein Rab-21 n=1 Tax=Tritrichomonas foetus TaxID=1144522 RepID=A0A1J4JZ58_9EUKA|nr:Ras-related protein Rab-21 [Tritrichomonas foetus]|eukprot:OHT04259.1 Ras-related protein Rab-21 [Tritrichomonas foetus]